MQYTMKAYVREALEPIEATVSVAHDRAALDAGRGLLRRRGAVHQVEVWRDARRVGTIERIV